MRCALLQTSVMFHSHVGDKITTCIMCTRYIRKKDYKSLTLYRNVSFIACTSPLLLSRALTESVTLMRAWRCSTGECTTTFHDDHLKNEFGELQILLLVPSCIPHCKSWFAVMCIPHHSWGPMPLSSCSCSVLCVSACNLIGPCQKGDAESHARNGMFSFRYSVAIRFSNSCARLLNVCNRFKAGTMRFFSNGVYIQNFFYTERYRAVNIGMT